MGCCLWRETVTVVRLVLLWKYTCVALCVHVLCVFQHYNCSGRSTLPSVLQPEVQPALPGLESSPSPAAHTCDLPEHRSNSALSAAGRSTQVCASRVLMPKLETCLIPFSPFPAPLVEGDALWENNLNNGGYNPTCLTLSRGLNDREHEKPVAQIRWLSSDP